MEQHSPQTLAFLQSDKALLSSDLGLTRADRAEQARRAAHVAAIVAASGLSRLSRLSPRTHMTGSEHVISTRSRACGSQRCG